MTPLVLAVVVLVILAVLVAYVVGVLVLMGVRALSLLPSQLTVQPKAPPAEEAPRWTALDDQQVARYLKQSPP